MNALERLRAHLEQHEHLAREIKQRADEDAKLDLDRRRRLEVLFQEAFEFVVLPVFCLFEGELKTRGFGAEITLEKEDGAILSAKLALSKPGWPMHGGLTCVREGREMKVSTWGSAGETAFTIGPDRLGQDVLEDNVMILISELFPAK